MKKFLIVFSIVLVLCCSIAIISNRNNTELGKEDSDNSSTLESTNSKELTSDSEEDVAKISSDEYFEIVSKAIKDNIEPAGYKVVRSSKLRTPYYTVDCEATDLDVSNFRDDVLRISENIYNELIKYEYKMPHIFAQSHEIIDLSFSVIRDGEVISGLCVQFDLTDIDKDKSFQENLIMPLS